jgi:hypothetical protein
MVWQRMLRPSGAPEWRLVGQENYAAMVSAICRRKRKSVSLQRDFVSSREHGPRMVAGYRAVSTTFRRVTQGR